MPQLSLWRGQAVKTNDYKFFDRVIKEMYNVGGTEFYIHKTIGTYAQDPGTNDTLSVDVSTSGAQDPNTTIQDVLNMENRDRKYDPNVYSLKGHYQVADLEFDLRQFGLFLSNDTIFITFHLNAMLDMIGRKLMSGDVIEILHQRDDSVLGSDAAINRYYVVEDGTRPAEGYSPTWWPHLWRVKCNPITDSTEFRDIMQSPLLDASGDPVPALDGNGGYATVGDALSTRDAENKITDAIAAAAQAEVPFYYFQTQHFYILPGQDPNVVGSPIIGDNDIWTGDGIPPNGSKPVNCGTSWPANPLNGDYFLRTDWCPPQLFQYDKSIWYRVQTDFRNQWLPANQGLVSFINNMNITTLQNGVQIPEQQNLRTAVKPKLDPDII
jgi:hypothetical protein